jgi:hypothetical protein
VLPVPPALRVQSVLLVPLARRAQPEAWAQQGPPALKAPQGLRDRRVQPERRAPLA